jgi:hypothetical protein
MNNSALNLTKLNAGTVFVQETDQLDRRRFYLYGDLRVVFPQRRSDADDVTVSGPCLGAVLELGIVTVWQLVKDM